MKQKILELLTAKFQGVSKPILDRIATKKTETITTEEQATQFVEGLTIQSLLDSYADYRATEATQTAVSNYEKKYGIKEGKPLEVIPTVQGAQVEPDITSIIQQAIASAVAPLTQKIESFEQADKQGKRMTTIQAKAKELGIPQSFVGRFHIPEDADIEEYMNGVKQDFVNIGFEGVKVPNIGGGVPDNGSDIANLINTGTAEIINAKK